MATEAVPVKLRRWNPTPTTLAAPLRWRKPALVEVVPDVFAPDVFAPETTNEFVDKVLAIIAAVGHSEGPFLLSTGHASEMRMSLTDPSRARRVADAIDDVLGEFPCRSHIQDDLLDGTRWPLPHLILGLRATDQASLDAALPDLRACPARSRWIDFHGLSGMVDIRHLLTCPSCDGSGTIVEQHDYCEERLACQCQGERPFAWIRVRGGSEPTDPRWLAQVVEQCRAAGVPVWAESLGIRELPEISRNQGRTVDVWQGF